MVKTTESLSTAVRAALESSGFGDSEVGRALQLSTRTSKRFRGGDGSPKTTLKIKDFLASSRPETLIAAIKAGKLTGES